MILFITLTVVFFVVVFYTQHKIVNKINTDSLNTYVQGADDIIRMTDILTEYYYNHMSNRVSIVRITNEDIHPRIGDKYYLKIIFSRGRDNQNIKKSINYIKVDKYYAQLMASIMENDFVKVSVADIPESFIKRMLTDMGTKEFIAFKLILTKNKFIYSVIASVKDGELNLTDIQRVRELMQNITKIYKI